MINFANVKEWQIPYNGNLVDVLQVKDSNNTRVIWEKPSVDKDWFFIENTTNSTITPTLKRGGSGNQNEVPILTIETSTDKETWTSAGTTSTSTAITFTIPANSKLYIRCDTTTWGGEYYNSASGYYEKSGNYFRGCPKVGGNVLSLMYGSSFTGTESDLKENWYSFACLFDGDTTLTDASELILPADDVSYYSYYCMFRSCTSLTNAPALPATNFNKIHWYEGQGKYATNCYSGMFAGCTSLTNAPVLPATTLSNSCYVGMFQNCTTLTTAPALPATILKDGCYQSMFRGCTSLITPPSLQATTLVDSCYNVMFYGCTSLNNIACYATSGINTNNSTSNWLSNVSSTGTFTKATGVTWPSGTSGIPSGWTVVEQ